MTQNDETKNLGEEQNEEQEQPGNKMEALLEESGINIDFPKVGEIRDGVIASITEGQILVSVGAKSEGIITGKEYEAIPADVLDTFTVGHAIPVFVITPEDSNGNLLLSFIRAVEEQSWIDAEAMMESGEVLQTKIVGYNKGGLLVPLGTIRGFIPASQVSLSRRLSISGDTPEAKYKEMIGEDVEVRVIEVDRERRRLILSERAASSETREMIKEKVIDDLEEGEVRTGRVTSLAAFGAFISIGGADGLVHLSEISWDHIDHPGDVLKVGEEVKVKIISVDKDRKRIGLSIRQLANDPWGKQISDLKVGQLVEGEITRLTNFGAFAKLKRAEEAGEVEGLIHISEISEKRIEHPKEVLHVGDVVTLRIVKIDEENHRIGLSVRRVDSPAYADLDWKNLAEEIDLTSDQTGEDISAFVESDQTEVLEHSEEPEELEASKESEELEESAKSEEPEEQEALAETEEPEEQEAPAEVEEPEEPEQTEEA